MPRLTRSPFYKRKSFLVLGIIFLLVMAGFIGFAVWRRENNKAIATDRARFEQAAKDVQTVADSINTALPPERQSVEKDCVYQSRDWAPKPIVCQIVYRSMYGSRTPQDANDIVNQLARLFSNHIRIFHYKGLGEAPESAQGVKEPNFLNAPLPNKSNVISQVYTEVSTNMTCPLSYEIYNSPTPPPAGEYPASTLPLTLEVTFLCSSNAKSVHYPITN